MGKVYTRENLIDDIKNMGITSSDAVLMHSSMRAIGNVYGGADTVIQAFMEALKDGMFMTPVHTWAQVSSEYNVFNPKTEDGCVGIIPNIFYKMQGVERSLHPTHSMAVWGKKNVVDCHGNSRIITAKDYVRGEENCNTPCTPGGCWDRLRDIDALILLVGVNHVKNTFIHAVEEVFEVPERLTDEPVRFKIVMADESYKEVDMYRHYNRHTAHISERFQKLAPAFDECNVTKYVKLGDADCILCSARGVYEVTKKVLSHEINCLIDRDEIPSWWWRA